MRSLFDRGPSDNYTPPSIIRPTGAPSGGGAVIARTMANRDNRQGGTMRGAGGMGFINRGSSLGTGIDYGTFSGPGAGGARFYGEGVVHLKRGGAAAQQPQPWDLIVGSEGQNYVVTVRPGTLNSILPSNWDTEKTISKSSQSLHYAKAVVSTDGEAVTGVSIQIDTNPPVIQTPTLYGLPGSVEYLFGLFAKGSNYRVIGNGHIELYSYMWHVIPRPGAGLNEPQYDVYYILI